MLGVTCFGDLGLWCLCGMRYGLASGADFGVVCLFRVALLFAV